MLKLQTLVQTYQKTDTHKQPKLLKKIFNYVFNRTRDVSLANHFCYYLKQCKTDNQFSAFIFVLNFVESFYCEEVSLQKNSPLNKIKNKTNQRQDSSLVSTILAVGSALLAFFFVTLRTNRSYTPDSYNQATNVGICCQRYESEVLSSEAVIFRKQNEQPPKPEIESHAVTLNPEDGYRIVRKKKTKSHYLKLDENEVQQIAAGEERDYFYKTRSHYLQLDHEEAKEVESQEERNYLRPDREQRRRLRRRFFQQRQNPNNQNNQSNN